jgi:hypothetical protein
MRRGLIIGLAALVAGACVPGAVEPTATPTLTVTPGIAPTPTPTPTPVGFPGGDQPTELPPPGHAFEFSRNYSGDATLTGQAHSCSGVRGPWSLEVAVSGSPEPGATIETTGSVVFTVPEDTDRVATRIPTLGTGIFDTGDAVGTGTINDPLVFEFVLAPDEQSAEITIVSTGEGIIVMHLPDAPDVTITFGTVFAADPTFTVSLEAYDGCP